jgi:methionyl-tRNA formyltransferase
VRVLFFGTPEFSLPTLRALLDSHEVVGVVTQPDRPSGRGQKLAASPVKRLAVERRLPVLQPERVRGSEWAQRLKALAPEVSVVAAFGQILPKAILDAPDKGSINVHASLLPRWRGAAPVAWALIRGETETGVTIFLMDEGMDTGPILLQERTPIFPEESAGELALRLSQIGAALLVKTLDSLDRLIPTPQNSEVATFAPRLTKEDGRINWSETARSLVNRVRGCNPWPGAAARWRGGRMIVWRGEALDEAVSAKPGTLVKSLSGRLAIATGGGLFLPREVQPENRRSMTWEEFINGFRLAPGDRFNPEP